MHQQSFTHYRIAPSTKKSFLTANHLSRSRSVLIEAEHLEIGPLPSCNYLTNTLCSSYIVSRKWHAILRMPIVVIRLDRGCLSKHSNRLTSIICVWNLFTYSNQHHALKTSIWGRMSHLSFVLWYEFQDYDGQYAMRLELVPEARILTIDTICHGQRCILDELTWSVAVALAPYNRQSWTTLTIRLKHRDWLPAYKTCSRAIQLLKSEEDFRRNAT